MTGLESSGFSRGEDHQRSSYCVLEAPLFYGRQAPAHDHTVYDLWHYGVDGFPTYLGWYETAGEAKTTADAREAFSVWPGGRA
jgi:hypothetical protein